MKRIIFPLIFASILFGGAGCLDSQPKMSPITLQYWRMEDNPADLAPIIEAYQETHPQVTIEVTRFSKENYQKELLTALAEDRGPDMFNIPHTWLRGWLHKIEPMPEVRTIIEKDTNSEGKLVNVRNKKNQISLIQLERDFVEVVPESVILEAPRADNSVPKEDKIFALPFSAGTLALYYNKDLLRNANVNEPPKTWIQLQEQARILSRKNSDDELEQSGAALGWTNVGHNTDILVALMVQNGAPMNKNGIPSFWHMPEGWDHSDSPAVEALSFYHSFSNKYSRNWSWDRDFDNDLDTFIAGRTAYYFGLPGDAREIRAQAPRLDLGVAPLPQVSISKRINVPMFPVETVSHKTKHSDYAWDFLVFASSSEQVGSFLASTKRPTSLRVLVNGQKTDDEIAPFVNQVLTAENWYLGYDYPKAESIFRDMVETEPGKELPYQAIINDHGSLIRWTYSKPIY